MDVPEKPRTTRNLPAVITLLFVAPFVAEYLLGDLPLKLVPVLIVLAPLYGGGAILIREIARRLGRGWPTMFVFGMAYTLIEEGFVTQSLFNPDYLKMHMHLLQPAYIPALGIGGWWTLFMFNLHTFWSISVSIAIVEALFPHRRASVWLGRTGDAIVAVMFVLGLAANTMIGFKQNHFVASHLQFLLAGVVCIIFVAAAILLPVRNTLHLEGRVPSPWVIGVCALGLGLCVTQTPPSWGWSAVGVILALDIVFLVFLNLLSRRSGWMSLHTLSVAAAGAIAYGLHAFFQKPIVPGALMMARLGNAVFFAIAIGLILVAAKRTARAESRMTRF